MDQKTFTGFIMFLFGLITTVYSQQTVTGTVTESQGPLPGVNIVIKGTQNGTTTDFDGNYTLSDVNNDAVLVFSYIGFITKEVPVAGQTIIDVTLEEDAAALDEIIVVGYGTQSKREVTGAISQIKSKDIAQVVVANPTAALQGKLAGVQVESAGGAPGSATNVFVRGVSSLTNSFPLYVVDGTVVDDIVFLNPKDIIDLQVLKDATSAAIYGTRAANGVIIITTNRGKKNSSPTVNVDIRGGINTQAKELDLLNGSEYIQFLNQRRVNDGLAGNIVDPGINTDFQDLTINSGAIQDYGFNISAGNDDSSYYFSANYYNEEGLLISEDFQRINARLNSQFQIGKFKIQESFAFAENTFTRNQSFGNQGPTLPILNAFNPNNEGGFEAVDGDIYGVGGTNKFALANLLDDENTERNLLGNINIAYEIIDGLTAKVNFGVDYKNIYRNTFLPTFFQSNTDATNNLNEANDLTEVRAEILSTNVEPNLNYKKVFGDHSVDVLLGGARQEVDFNSLAVYAQGLPSNNIRNIGNFTDQVENTGGGKFLSRLFSYYARVNYKLKDRYLFTGIVRRDATSRFSSDDDLNTGVFPSFSLGWVVSEEDFWPEDGFINTLKLRGGYGELGSQNIGDYVYQSVLNPTSNVAFANNPAQGFSITSLVDESISFETSATTNIGADLTMFNNSIKLSLDYFSRNNEDVLLAVDIPSTTGSGAPVIQNAAAINNKGFELEASYKHDTGSDFTFDIGLNIAAITNELTEAPNPILGPIINEEQTRVNRYEEGQPLGFFFGFETDGIYNSQAEIDNDPFLVNDPDRRALLQPGDFRRVDTNGDGRIDESDRTNLGDPTPDFTYGINFTGNYKKFDFGLFFNGVQGSEIYNVTKFFGVFFADDNKFGLVRDAFTPTNTDTNIPRVSNLDPAGNQLPSDFFVEDGSFFRLKTLEIGYDLTDVIGSEWVKSGRVFFNMQNVFVITGYSGYDPEVGSTSGAQADADTGFFGFRDVTNPILGRGLDVRAQPRPRTFIMGLQFSF